MEPTILCGDLLSQNGKHEGSPVFVCSLLSLLEGFLPSVLPSFPLCILVISVQSASSPPPFTAPPLFLALLSTSPFSRLQREEGVSMATRQRWELEEKVGDWKLAGLCCMAGWEKCWYGGIGNILISDTFDHVYGKYKVMHVMSFGENTAHCLLYQWIHLSSNRKMVMLPEHLQVQELCLKM